MAINKQMSTCVQLLRSFISPAGFMKKRLLKHLGVGVKKSRPESSGGKSVISTSQKCSVTLKGSWKGKKKAHGMKKEPENRCYVQSLVTRCMCAELVICYIMTSPGYSVTANCPLNSVAITIDTYYVSRKTVNTRGTGNLQCSRFLEITSKK